MGYWNEIPERIVGNFSTWRKWYIVLFALIATSANILPAVDPSLNNAGPPSTVLTVVSLVYIFMSIGAIFILGRAFAHRLRSDGKLFMIRADVQRTEYPPALKAYRLLYPVFLYFFMLCIGLSAAFTLDMVANLFNPHLTETQNIPTFGNNQLYMLLLSLLASLEEFWRWSMIVTVLLVVRAVAKESWREHANFRRNAFVVAIVLSSLGFGAGHLAEFDRFKWQALLMLSTTGALLAVFAIVTRRFWLAVAMHFIYDEIAFQSNQWPMFIVFVLGLLGLFIFFPILVRLFKQVKPYLNLAEYPHS